MTHVEVCSMAKALGAKSVVPGIGWTWAKSFPTKEKAEAFIKALPPGYETRGTYRDNPYMTEHSVRFR